MQLKTGDRIGDYEVLGVLGAGGMGSVYKVRNVISDRVEAIKLLLPNLVEHQDLKDRFLREIKTSASLEHPAIASLRTAFQSGDMLLMVMEYVEGQTLDARLQAGPIGIEEAVRITANVLDALEYAHSRGVVHRDIKPANIMLAKKGGVKLLDFGIAKATTDKQITIAGTTMGSLYYMSPEQIRGEQVDGRADLYSLGITLYELTTGKRPFGGESGYAIMAEHLQKQPVPPLDIAPNVPATLSAVILRSLAKNPDDRYHSAEHFRQDLLSVLSPAEATQIVGQGSPKPSSHQTAATMPSAQPISAPMTFAPTPPQHPPAPPVSPAPPADPAASIETPKPAPAPTVAPAFVASPGLSAPPLSTETPRKPSNTLALVLVALIAVVVLGSVILVFAGSWFFGSSDTTTANAQPGLMQRIGSLFSRDNTPEASSEPAAVDDTLAADDAAPENAMSSVDEPQLASNGAGSAALSGNASTTATPGSRLSSSAPASSRSATMPSRTSVTQSSAGQAATGGADTGQKALSSAASAPTATQTPAAAATSPAPAVVAGPDPRELEVSRDFFSKLGIRAGTIQESARKLSQEQSAMGVGLRADMRAALKRMEYLMDQAEGSLDRGNLDQAKQHMQGAEREIEKLEKFFRI